MRKTTGICVIVLLLSLAACKVGPNYHMPRLATPARWAEARPQDSVTTATLALGRWWTRLNDTKLNSLVDRAIRSNLDLRLAKARIQEERALYRVSESGLWPTLNASGSYARRQRSMLTTSGAGSSSLSGSSGGTGTSGSSAAKPSRQSELYQAGFDASWELDVFGGTRRGVEAARADVQAAEESRRDVLVTLLGEVARAYVDLRGAQQQLALTRENLKAQQQTLDLTRVRFEVGVVSELDVTRARAQVAATAAQIPALESQIHQTIHQLGVLLGQQPETLLAELSVPGPIPVPPVTIAAGLPSELLRRRPDIRLAERNLAAATARIGVAVADLYPKFMLTGALAQQSLNTNNLFKGGATAWSFGPSVNWPVFAGGQIRANIQVQNARQEQALVRYEQAVLGALRETEDALVAYSSDLQRERSLSEAVAANRRAVDLSNDLYLNGLGDFLNVLDAQRSLYATQLLLAQNQAAISADLVALYKALGGGWEGIYPNPPAPAGGHRPVGHR